MTVPYERTLAVLHTRELLKELAYGESDNVDDGLRRRAAALLKHFPVAADMDASAAALPAVWARSFAKGRAG
ncbi:BPSL0761 family protein [Paraburkholderia tagetis]|uniref:BPSL0761 family protein n=1 Tax=Paraburkholderia tagetis TaxID=2913261 RepID=UPI0030840380